jgi:predicted permease
MTVVLVCFNWPIALLVIWPMELKKDLIWLPLIGLVLMLSVTAFSAMLFPSLKSKPKSWLTFILAGGVSNQGYTGGAFVCYALFGAPGIALAQIFLFLSLPVFYLVYLPLLKIYEFQSGKNNKRSILNFLLDFRMLIMPAMLIAILLNRSALKPPAFIMELHIVDILVYIASSLSFFAVGLQVNLSALKNYTNLYLPLAAVKFILTPALAVVLLWLLALAGQDLNTLARRVIIVLSASPSAVLMVTMSNVFDLDGPLASALWVVTMAVFAVVVVPVLFLIFT